MYLTLLPYEILQLVATWLLPRYQCRLAIASKWCYRYLYTDLLLWHAKRAVIEIPKYRIVTDKMSVIGYNRNINMYNTDFCTASIGHTNATCMQVPLLEIRSIAMANIVINDAYRRVYMINANMSEFPFPMTHGIQLIDGFYKYLSRELFIKFVCMRLSPLLSLPPYVLRRIMRRLPAESRDTLRYEVHPYLTDVLE